MAEMMVKCAETVQLLSEILSGMQQECKDCSDFCLCHVAQLSKLCEVLEKHCHFVDFNELF